MKNFLITASVVAILILFVAKSDELQDYLLNAEQEAFISELHPTARNKFRQFIHRVQTELGWDIIITSGYRSFWEQYVIDQANDANAEPGYSWHNYGLAIDINAVKNGTWLKKNTGSSAWNASGIPALAAEMGIAWGGLFSGYYDPVHFDLRGFYPPIGELYADALAQSGGNWQNFNGNQMNFV